jgi:hypothetical protein
MSIDLEIGRQGHLLPQLPVMTFRQGYQPMEAMCRALRPAERRPVPEASGGPLMEQSTAG